MTSPRKHTLSYELSGEFPESPKDDVWRITLYMYVDGALAISVTGRHPVLLEAIEIVRSTLIFAYREFMSHGQLLMDLPDAMVRYGDGLASLRLVDLT